MNHKISVIVPIYNCEAYLEKCLTSLREQSYKNLEVLMVDDGSQDASAEIAKAFAAADARFLYAYQPNAGVSAARNKGLDMATGDYIGFCDADDWVAPDMYESLYSLTQEHHAEIAITSFIREISGKEIAWRDDLSVYAFSAEEAIREMLKGQLFGGYLCNKLFNSGLFKNIRLDREIAIYEDMLACWEAMRLSEKIVFQDVHKYHYVINNQSAMSSLYKEKHWTGREAAYRLYDKMCLYFPENAYYAERTIAVNSYWLAEKMAMSSCLTKEKYEILKQDLEAHYTDNVAALLEESLKRKINLLVKGRLLFILFVKALAGYREVKKCLGK